MKILITEKQLKTLLEVRYVQDQDLFNNIPLKDDETIIVYHGFDNLRTALYCAKFGLSGKQKANRKYSYELENNPKGLFVSVDFNTVKKEFGNHGIIMEFATKVSNLEAPIWAGGRSYFVQGEYTTGFNYNNFDQEREQQRLSNREREKANLLPSISQSDRPELAQTIYQNREKQALFIGDLNPNMIKGFWINADILTKKSYKGTWERLSRLEFLKEYYTEENLKTYVHSTSGFEKKYSDEHYNRLQKIFKPADDFNIEKFKNYFKNENYDYNEVLEYYIRNWDDYFINTHLYPKQIAQLKDYYNIH